MISRLGCGAGLHTTIEKADGFIQEKDTRTPQAPTALDGSIL